MYKHNMKSITELTKQDSLILSSSSESKINKDQRYFKYLRKSHNLKKILDIVKTTFNHYFNIILINHRFNIETYDIILLLESGIVGLKNFLSYYETLTNEYPTYDIYSNSYNNLNETINFLINKLDDVKNIIENNEYLDAFQSEEESEKESEKESEEESEEESEKESEEENERENEEENDNMLLYVKDMVVNFLITVRYYIISFLDFITPNDI